MQWNRRIQNVRPVREADSGGKKKWEKCFLAFSINHTQNVYIEERSIQFIIKNPSLIKLQLQIVTLKEEDKSFAGTVIVFIMVDCATFLVCH